MSDAHGAQVGTDLLSELRRATAGLHRQVEDAADLPSSVRTRADYACLLSALHGVHAGIESQLNDTAFHDSWAGIGINLTSHRRSDLLSDDLSRMLSVATGPNWAPHLSTFGQALGCLYVVEGSTLGGRILAPQFRAILGDVPVSFFDGGSRGHPSPWRKIVAALRLYPDTTDEVNQVLIGARTAFRGFRNQLNTSARNRTVTR